MKKSFQLTALAICAAAVLCGCATSSDRLGLAKDEATKTYAEAYQPARDMLIGNKLDELRTSLLENQKGDDGQPLTNEENAEKLFESASELSLLERGLLSLNTGDYNRALYYFDIAERKLTNAEDNSTMGDKAAKVGKFGFATLLGSEEVSDYELRGYEKVMLLNYKALCYMLSGDRRAYNVTRRAIDRQQEEWEKFQEELEKLKAKEGTNPQADQLASQINVDDRPAEVKQKASLVASAYVNPFGDYVNGMLQEFDSLEDKSLRDNARISYEKAVKNNPKCTAAATAVKQVVKNPPAGRKLVQVLLSDGFSPMRSEKNVKYNIDKMIIDVNLPVTLPIESQYGSSDVVVNGQRVKLSSLTQMESLVLRDDQDRMPMKLAMVVVNALRSMAASSVLGKFGSSISSTIQHPDTRSWLTLPNRIDVARFYVPNSVKEIKLRTFDGEGKQLAETKVSIAEKGPTVVYASSYGANLNAFGNSFSWVK